MLVQFALIWWLTKSTGSATILATAAAFSIIPEIINSPTAGAIVDCYSRKTVIIIADASISAAAITNELKFRIQNMILFVISPQEVLLDDSLRPGFTRCFQTAVPSASIQIMPR